jgi:gas vesicle protein
MRIGKYEVSESQSSVGTAVTFLLIGLGAGAALALLLAPKTGKQLRRDLRRGYEDASDRLQEFAEQTRERAEDLRDRGSDLAEKLRDKAAPIARAMNR